MNDGYIHEEIYDLSMEEKEKVAEDFGEGNKYLKQLLLNLWEVDVKTYGCCAGHNDRSSFEAYISMEVNNVSYGIISPLLSLIIDNNIDGVEFDFFGRYDKDGNVQDKLVCCITVLEEQLRDTIFHKLVMLSKVPKQTYEKCEIIDNSLLIKDFIVKYNIQFRYLVVAGLSMISFTRPYAMAPFFPDSPHLNEILELFRKKEKLRLGSYKCDNESIREFLNIIYPNLEFENEDRKIK